MATEQDVTESLEPEQATAPDELEPEQATETEPDERELEPVELDPDELAEIEREILEEFASSEEEPPPKPKRARIKAEPKAKPPQAKPEPKRRGRPPGSRNVVRPAPLAPAPPAQYDPTEAIMMSMRERRQAHQERQQVFFQRFLP